jgi:pilus assembly protein Flp/PilA
MSKLIAAARKFMTDDSGATMVEYALMVALVAAVCVVAVTALGTALSGQFTTIAGNV